MDKKEKFERNVDKKPNAFINFLKSRKARSGGIAIAITAVFICIIILIKRELCIFNWITILINNYKEYKREWRSYFPLSSFRTILASSTNTSLLISFIQSTRRSKTICFSMFIFSLTSSPTIWCISLSFYSLLF